MNDNSSRDLIIGAALALLLWWHFRNSGAAASTSGFLSNGTTPATAPSGAAGAGTVGAAGGCGCGGSGRPLPAPPVFAPHLIAETPTAGPYAGMSAIA